MKKLFLLLTLSFFSITSLAKGTMDFAKVNNAMFVQLETQADNYTAQSLYESVGFIQQEPDTEFLVYRKSVD